MFKRLLAAAAALTLLAVSCQFGPPPEPIAAPVPTASPAVTRAVTPPCETHTAGVTLASSAASIDVGQPVTVTVTLENEGCVALGLPQYRLTFESDAAAPALLPAVVEPVVHTLAVAPGGSDLAEFTFTGAAAGEATITASASFEVHLGYPGPAYWGASGVTEPLRIAVAP